MASEFIECAGGCGTVVRARHEGMAYCDDCVRYGGPAPDPVLRYLGSAEAVEHFKAEAREDPSMAVHNALRLYRSRTDGDKVRIVNAARALWEAIT